MEIDSRAVDLLQQLGDVVSRLQSGTVGDQGSLIQEAEDLAYDAERELTDLQPQIRHLGYQEKHEASRRMENHRARLRRFEETVKQLKLNQHPAGGVNLAALSRQDRQAYKQERERLLTAKGMIDEDDESIRRTIQTIGETTEVGIATTVELQEQRESMIRSKDALNESNDFLVRSRNTLRRMRRRLMTSKLISFAIILVELLIIALIIWLKYFND